MKRREEIQHRKKEIDKLICVKKLEIPKSEFDKLFDERDALIKEEYDLLEPIVELTNNNKSTLFALFIYNVIEKIKKRCEEFVVEYFDEKGFCPQEIYVRNLVMDLDYMFSQGLWFIKLAEQLGLNVDDAKRFLCDDIIDYEEKGWICIVANHIPKYNREENRLYSDEELKTMQEKGNKIATKMLKEMFAEEKSKK